MLWLEEEYCIVSDTLSLGCAFGPRRYPLQHGNYKFAPVSGRIWKSCTGKRKGKNSPPKIPCTGIAIWPETFVTLTLGLKASVRKDSEKKLSTDGLGVELRREKY